MAYALKLSQKAQRQLADLPEHISRRVARWIGLLGEDPFRQPSRQLEGYPELRRVHAVLNDDVVVLIVRIAHRREVHRRL